VKTLATKVFEEDWVEDVRRRYGSMSTYIRPFVAFLALDPKAVAERSKIEEWFKILPEDMKPDFLKRLRSQNDCQHFGAYNELLVCHLFRSGGYSVTMRPKLKEGEPDLLVEGKNQKTPVVVEVTTVFDEPRWVSEKKKQNKILAELDKIQHHYLATVSFRSDNIPEKVNYKKLRQFVEGWLNNIDHQEIEARSQISYSYREGGLWLELELFPQKTSGKSSIIGGVIYPVRAISGTQLKSAIEKKIQKYKSVKELNCPYMIAACFDTNVPAVEEQVINALFGRPSVTVDIAKGGIVDVGRDFSGLVTPKPGLGGLAQNTRLSALLVVRSKWLQPLDKGEECRQHFAFVLHNPNAEIALSEEFLRGYPQLVKSHEDDRKVDLKWIDRVSQGYVNL
jgi:hypothetical protein